MLGRTTGIRFEYAALGLMILSVGLLYGMVLSGPSGEALHPAPAASPPVADAVAPAPSESSQAPVKDTAEVAAQTQHVHATSPAVVSDLTVSNLVSVFRHTDYLLGNILAGETAVPRILVDAMPADLAGVKSPADRKRVFIKVMLPLALRVNEQILSDRKRLTRMEEKLNGFIGTLDPEEITWLEDMRRRYRAKTADIATLLRHVDVIPPSLTLAQAAEESGWGTSRFAREGNALFGQRSFTKGKGLAPLNPDGDQSFEVVVYDRLLDSVAAYVANLNSHYAYSEFRRAREYQRKAQGSLDGYDLAGTLDRYSERGEAYVGTIRSIIEKNGLRSLDRARLGEGDTIIAIDTDI